MKRFLCGLMSLVILLTGLCFAAAEDADDEDAEQLELTDEEMDEIRWRAG